MYDVGTKVRFQDWLHTYGNTYTWYKKQSEKVRADIYAEYQATQGKEDNA